MSEPMDPIEYLDALADLDVYAEVLDSIDVTMREMLLEELDEQEREFKVMLREMKAK